MSDAAHSSLSKPADRPVGWKGWLRAWFLAARPKTLSASFAPILVGTGLGYSLTVPRSWDRWWISALALASSLFIQIATNLVNDAQDFKRGADTAERQGPVRVTAQGWIRPETVMAAAVFCFLLSIFLGIPLVVEGGMPIVWVGLISCLAGYAYTGGPFPLAYLGLGEVFVILFFGFVAVGGISFLWNDGIFPSEALIAGLQVGLLSTVLIAINNLRDIPGDRKAGKKTLAARWGEGFARREIAVLLLSPFAMGSFWVFENRNWAAYLPLLVLPIAVKLVALAIRTPIGPELNLLLARSAALQMLFAILLGLGLALPR